MKKEKINIIKEEKEFLSYLYKNYGDNEKGKKEILVKKFGKEKYKRVYHLLIGKEITLLKNVEGKKFEYIFLTPQGIKRLEEIEKEERKFKNSRLMFLSSMLLILVTIIYVLFTAQLVKITKAQFEIETQPLLETINLIEDSNSGELYVLEIMNIGNSIAKIKEAEIIHTFEDGVSVSLVSPLQYEILPNQKKEIIFIDSQKIFGNSKELFWSRIEIRYYGENDNFEKEHLLNRSFYEYEKTFHIYN